jgi:hypothetical protein
MQGQKEETEGHLHQRKDHGHCHLLEKMDRETEHKRMRQRRRPVKGQIQNGKRVLITDPQNGHSKETRPAEPATLETTDHTVEVAAKKMVLMMCIQFAMQPAARLAS